MLKLKTLSLFSIKKLSRLNFQKSSIWLTFFLFFYSTHFAQSEEIKPNLIKCEVSRSISEKTDYEFIKSKSQKFSDKLNLLGQNEEIDNYNLFVSNGTKPSAGYKLNFVKAVRKRNKINIYFTEIKPPQLSINAAVLTYPYCLLNIKDEKKFIIFIDNKKKKKSFFKLFIF